MPMMFAAESKQKPVNVFKQTFPSAAIKREKYGLFLL